jgi:hypothetical protein
MKIRATFYSRPLTECTESRSVSGRQHDTKCLHYSRTVKVS